VTMGLKCSVFGHSYADTDVQREREEQGSEVVITIREVETCERCGEERVVSENKEVTTLETPDIEPDPAPEGESLVAESTGTDHGEGARDAELVDEPAADAGGTAESEPAPTDGLEEAPEAPADPAADDGVILEEEPADPPEPEGRQPGEWPEDSEDDEPDWVAETEPVGAPPEDERRQDLESAGTAVTVPDGEFQCPECGFTTDVESSSLRSGDFCPECHTGSLEHHGEDS